MAEMKRGLQSDPMHFLRLVFLSDLIWGITASASQIFRKSRLVWMHSSFGKREGGRRWEGGQRWEGGRRWERNTITTYAYCKPFFIFLNG